MVLIELAKGLLIQLLRAVQAWTRSWAARLESMSADESAPPPPAASTQWLENHFRQAYPGPPAHWLEDIQTIRARAEPDSSGETITEPDGWLRWREGSGLERAALPTRKPGHSAAHVQSASPETLRPANHVRSIDPDIPPPDSPHRRNDLRGSEDREQVPPRRRPPNRPSTPKLGEPPLETGLEPRKVSRQRENRERARTSGHEAIGPAFRSDLGEVRPREPGAPARPHRLTSDRPTTRVRRHVDREMERRVPPDAWPPVEVSGSSTAPPVASLPSFGVRAQAENAPVETAEPAAKDQREPFPSSVKNRWPSLLEPGDDWYEEFEAPGRTRERRRVLELEQEGKRWNS